MPNYVTHKITFDPAKADEVFEAVKGPHSAFDFERLVPIPPNMYRGNINSEDEKDFPINWLSWSRDNWGTKWNCSSAKVGIEDGKAYVKFQTAWSVPYPIIAAILNRFGFPFELRYYDEAPNFWGVETYGPDPWDGKDNPRIVRLSKRFTHDDDRKAIELDFFGEERPDDEDE